MMIYLYRALAGLGVLIGATIISYGLGTLFLGITESLVGENPTAMETIMAGITMLISMIVISIVIYWLGFLLI